MTEDTMAPLLRLVQATNAHDLEGIVACFAEDYSLEAPLHPARSFRGRDQVRRNWAQILGGVPDIVVRIVSSARDRDTFWTEWEMTGTRRDGATHWMRGVFIFVVRDGFVRSGRMFFEPVDTSTTNMDQAVSHAVASRGGHA